MDEYERLETLRKRLKDQERWDGLSNEELRDRRYKVERAIRDLLIAEPLEAATAPVETRPSSPATGSMEAQPSTNNISLRTFCLVRGDLNGEPEIMATVTVPGHSFIRTPGALRNFLQGMDWTIPIHMMSESLWPSGWAPSVSREEPGAGRVVGGPVTLDFDNECNCAGGWPIPHGERDHANAPDPGESTAGASGDAGHCDDCRACRALLRLHADHDADA